MSEDKLIKTFVVIGLITIITLGIWLITKAIPYLTPITNTNGF